MSILTSRCAAAGRAAGGGGSNRRIALQIPLPGWFALCVYLPPAMLQRPLRGAGTRRALIHSTVKCQWPGESPAIGISVM